MDEWEDEWGWGRGMGSWLYKYIQYVSLRLEQHDVMYMAGGGGRQEVRYKMAQSETLPFTGGEPPLLTVSGNR